MESQLRAWLTLQCQSISGAKAGLVVIGASEQAPGACLAHWPCREDVTRRLSATLEAARRRGGLVVQEPRGGAKTTRATLHVALPLVRQGRVVGAAGVSVQGIAPADAKAVVERIEKSLRGLELLLDAHAGESRLSSRLALAGSLLDHERVAEAAHALAAELAQRLGCERVAVGLQRRGRLRVAALSTSARFTQESDAVRDLRCAMQEALEQDAVIELPPPAGAAPHALRDHELLVRGSGAGGACTVPLAARGEAVGALTCEWSRGKALDAAQRGTLHDAALLAGPILDLLARAEADPLERARAWLVRLVDRRFGGDRALARAALAVVAGLVLLVAVVPGSYRISARAKLEGRVQRALVAGVASYLAEANVRAGDLVRAGDVLAQLDDRDLRLELRRWESRKLQLEKEYREALAGEDRTRVSILDAQIDQAEAQLGLVEEQLARTRVVAPFDGVVVEGDLDRALGSPVELGRVLFELAPLDGYRIILQVDERDFADVAVGQRGRLALSALPGRPLPMVVERMTPLSTAGDGRNYFRVEAALEEPLATLRPGMEGVAKIDAGRRRLLWIWTHGLLDWLRLRTWSLLP